MIQSIKQFFQYYKVAEGKAENEYALDGKILEREEAIDIIQETHTVWASKYKK